MVVLAADGWKYHFNAKNTRYTHNLINLLGERKTGGGFLGGLERAGGGRYRFRVGFDLTYRALLSLEWWGGFDGDECCDRGAPLFFLILLLNLGA